MKKENNHTFFVILFILIIGMIYINPDYFTQFFSLNGQVTSSPLDLSLTITDENLTFPETPPIIGGGGSRANLENIDPISINPNEISLSIKEKETKREYIAITNNLNKEIQLTIDFSDVKDFVYLITGEVKQKVTLKPHENTTIQVVFNPSDQIKPDLYIKNILITAESVTKTVKAIILVQVESPLFDVIIKTPKNYDSIKVGDILASEVTIKNIKNTENKIDVWVSYNIKDDNGKTIYEQNETRGFAIETTFNKEIALPRNIPLGEYYFYVKVNYEGITAGAFYKFIIIKEEKLTYPLSLKSYTGLIVLLIVSMIIIIMTIYFIIYNPKNKKKSKKEEIIGK